jgi:threonyl-tRNA synthetase
MATDAIGREHQVATVQLDFVQPQRFELVYTNEDGQLSTPVMIHCALLGSIERFLSVYIEHTAGKFPVWLAPEQVRFITVNQTDKISSYGNKQLELAKSLGLRATLDNANESVGKKIRNAEKMKIPYVIVIGEQEAESGETIPRVRSDMAVQDQTKIRIENFLKTVLNESISRTTHTTV